MTIFNFGSINIDNVYQLDHFPAPGETLAARSFHVGLGGKGANQSVAAARAGANIQHIGAIGADSDWTLEIMNKANVSTKFVKSSSQPTGHAIINLDASAENTIVIVDGANHDMDVAWLDAALADAKPGDWFLLQNETNMCAHAARRASARGLKIAYSAAPFNEKALQEILPICDLLVLNEVEVAQARAAIRDFDILLDRAVLVVTKGARGAEFRSADKSESFRSIVVKAKDTTGAGDTFLGYLLAQLEADQDLDAAIECAIAAAAIQVTRMGAISAIPFLSEVESFRKNL